MSGRPTRRYLAFVSVSAIVIVAVLISASIFLMIGQAAKPETVTETLAGTTTVDGSSYYVDNVTNIIIAENPGMFHFNNGSVTFLGVKFQTICTSYFSQCPDVAPPPSNVTVAVQSGAGIALNVTFPDHSSEMIAGAFPLVPVYFSTFSRHTDPQAGILIVYTNSSPGYKSYLLVST